MVCAVCLSVFIWWRYDMKTPALCGENPPVISGYPYETGSKWSFGIFLVVMHQIHICKYKLTLKLAWVNHPHDITPLLHLSIVAKNFYCNDNTFTEFEIIDCKNSSTAYVILYELIDVWVLDSNRRVGVWSLPCRWHILSILLTAGRGTGAKTCGLDDVFPPDDLCSRPEALC